jgi:hypothetical protein
MGFFLLSWKESLSIDGKNVDIYFSENDFFLEWPSSGLLLGVKDCKIKGRTAISHLILFIPEETCRPY